MTIIAAFLLCLSVNAAHSGELTCTHSIRCPCGSTGENVTVCVSDVTTDDVCTRLSECVSCEDGSDVCSKCPEGLEGPLCSQEIRKSRQKRQRQQWRRQRPKFASLTIASDCSNLDAPKLGGIRCITNSQERTCVGKCLPGYTFMHDSKDEIILTCHRGVWTPLASFPNCESGGHCDLIVEGSGSFNCTTGMHGTLCDVRCNNRYAGQYYCYPGRAWEPSLPRCVISKEAPEDRHDCFCQNGGTCDSSGNCHCPAGRTGSNCEIAAPELMCPDPGHVANAERLNTDNSPSMGVQQYKVGQSVAYTCNPGYALQRRSLITCLSSGAWSFRTPYCIRVAPTAGTRNATSGSNTPNLKYCRDPGVDPNGIRQPRIPPNRRGFPQGSQLEYSCEQNYDIIGEWRLFCLTSGEWSASRPSCQVQTPEEPAYCMDPGPISNGQVVLLSGSNKLQPAYLGDPEYPEGSRLRYHCDSGYSLVGQATIICERSGFWSAESPTCSRSSNLKYCDYPGDIVNGRVVHIPSLNQRRRPSNRDDEDAERYPAESQLQFSCLEGYILEGPAILTCENTGRWSSKPPTCLNSNPDDIHYCESPEPILNGKMRYFPPAVGPRSNRKFSNLDYDVDEYAEGSVVEYTCEENYNLQGSQYLTCQSTGFWSSKAPSCVADCGRSYIQATSRVFFGQKTKSGEWPWVVSIWGEYNNNSSRFICGGAVLNSHTVITAAHCLADGATGYILRFGKHHFKIQDDDPDVLTIRTSNALIHPEYNHTDRALDADIGLLRFQQKIRFSSRVQPICLPSQESTLRNIMTGRIGYVCGWGETEHAMPPDTMMRVTLPVITTEACLEAFRQQNLIINENMFCAGHEDGSQTVCGGDSGSPLVFYDSTSERYTIEGLVSFAARGQCGAAGKYAIFTKVFRFLNWIYANWQRTNAPL